MLKRFMTWLLNKLQKIAGALSAKRGKGYKSTSSTRGLDNLELDSSIPDVESEGAEVAIAERISYAPPVAELPSDSPSERLDTPSSESAIVAQSADPLRNSAASTQVSKDSANDIDIRNRLDAASSSVSGILEEKPSFPTEVSALLSSDDEGIINDVVDLAAHPSETISDEQLPAIQDLLPAIPSSQGIGTDLGSAADQRSAANQNGDRNDESASDDEIAYESAIDDELEDEVLASSEIETQDTALLEENATATEVDQPIVFTFDIIESKDDDSSEEKVDTAIETPAIAADSTPLASDDRDTDSSRLLTEYIDLSDREPAVTEESTILEGAQSLAPDSETEGLVDSSEAESANAVEALPYPWSTANPPNTDLSTTDQRDSEKTFEDTSGKVDIEVLSEGADATSESSPLPAESSQSETASEGQPVKQGTVKLLFTMKKGNFHGYIAPDDGSKDILFHQKYINADIFSQLERGAQVSATVKYIEGKAYATRVDLQK